MRVPFMIPLLGTPQSEIRDRLLADFDRRGQAQLRAATFEARLCRDRSAVQALARALDRDDLDDQAKVALRTTLRTAKDLLNQTQQALVRAQDECRTLDKHIHTLKLRLAIAEALETQQANA